LKAILLFSITSTANATEKIGVLELVDKTNSPHESVAYLTDQLRTLASEELQSARYLILTRENIWDLLPPEITLEDCEISDCEVQLGRMVGAEYIITGYLHLFAQEYRITVKLHHTESGAFLGSRTAEGRDLLELERDIIPEVRPLFDILKHHARLIDPDHSQSDSQKIYHTEVVVEFDSQPRGALLMIDGEATGHTPCAIALREGFSEVSMQVVNHYSRSKRIEVRPNMPQIVWELEPRIGSVIFRTFDGKRNAIAANVLIDGKISGKTFQPVSYIVGEHAIRIESNTRYWTQKVAFIEGVTQEMDVVLASSRKQWRPFSYVGFVEVIGYGGYSADSSESTFHRFGVGIFGLHGKYFGIRLLSLYSSLDGDEFVGIGPVYIHLPMYTTRSTRVDAQISGLYPGVEDPGSQLWKDIPLGRITVGMRVLRNINEGFYMFMELGYEQEKSRHEVNLGEGESRLQYEKQSGPYIALGIGLGGVVNRQLSR